MVSKNAVQPCPKITIKEKHLRDNFIDVIMTEIEDDKSWKNTLALKFECEEEEIANKSINEMRNIMDSWIEKKDVITEENKGKISFETRTLANQFLSDLTSLVLCNLTVNQLEIHSKDYFPKKCTVELSCNSIKNTIENEPPLKMKNEEKEEMVIGSAIVKEEPSEEKEEMVIGSATVKDEPSCNDLDFDVDGILDVCEETRLNLEKDKTQKRSLNEDEDEAEIVKKKKKEKHFSKNLQKLTFRENSDSNILVEHLDERLSKTIQNDMEKKKTNIPKIQQTFDTIYSFVLTLEKTLKKNTHLQRPFYERT